MKISEVIVGNQQRRPVAVQPTVVKQQARVAGVVGQIAASHQQQQQKPTEMDIVMGMQAYSDLKKKTDKTYAERLKQQLANAQAATR